MAGAKPPLRRCAVYTRKSSEEGLEQDFNSLDAQREACEAFIRSQKGEGWRLIEAAYDDGGLSGATMGRAGLQRLLADIRSGQVDIVVVYKVDRLTRSLSDFAKMVEVFDAHGVSFVAVTQQFNTTTSMGRLTLNILLSFAQFEREVTGERIRDKIAASKRKGMWMGGYVPLGYDVKDRKLLVNPSEAETVRLIFRRYLALGSVRRLKEELDRSEIRSKVRIAANGSRSVGTSFSRGALYALLQNAIYVGDIRHKGVCHTGQHKPIIDRAVWEQTQQRLRNNAVERGAPRGKVAPSPLVGKLFDEMGERLTPSHAVKNGRRYRYYVSRGLLAGTNRIAAKGLRLPASEIERSVALAVDKILSDGSAVVAALREAETALEDIPGILKALEALRRLSRSESSIKPELASLVDRVVVLEAGISVTLSLRTSLAPKRRGRFTARATVARLIPMEIKRRGSEMRLVIADGDAPPVARDPALLKAIARAHCWFDELASGHAASLREVAKHERISGRYVTRLVRLAFLAPSLIEEFTRGRQPAEVTAELLTNQIELHFDWDQQRAALLPRSGS